MKNKTVNIDGLYCVFIFNILVLLSNILLTNLNSTLLIKILILFILTIYILFLYKKLKDSKYKILKNIYYKKYYKDHIISARILNLGLFLCIPLEVNSLTIGIFLVLIGIVAPVFVEKNWK